MEILDFKNPKYTPAGPFIIDPYDSEIDGTVISDLSEAPAQKIKSFRLDLVLDSFFNISLKRANFYLYFRKGN